MKIATFNVNGVNGRLPRLLEWLAEAKPDVACLQEIKTGDATFPIARDRSGRLPRRLARPAAPSRRRDPGASRAADRGPARAARRRGRRPGALSRGRCRRPARRLGVPAERQSAARTQVRFQAGLVRSPHRSRGEPDRGTAGASFSPATSTSCRPMPTSTTPGCGSTMPCCSRRAGPRIGACSRKAGSTRRVICMATSASTRSG